MQKEMVALRIAFLVVSFISCNTRSTVGYSFPDVYEIIETKRYNDSVLFYKTIPGNQLVEMRLNYKSLNGHNFQKNWALENERHINFDTIFNKRQQNEIDRKIEALESFVLAPNRLHNPNILYTPDEHVKEVITKKVGLEKISFPFIQKGKNGNLYAFIYRENPTQGIFYIYKLIDGKWKEFSKLQIWIA